MWIKILVWLGVYSKQDGKILQFIEEYKDMRKLLEIGLQDYDRPNRGFCSCISILHKDSSKIHKLSDAKHLIDAFHEYFPKEYDKYYKYSHSENYWFTRGITGTKKRIFLLNKTIENLQKLC